MKQDATKNSYHCDDTCVKICVLWKNLFNDITLVTIKK